MIESGEQLEIGAVDADQDWPVSRDIDTARGRFSLRYHLVQSEEALARMVKTVSEAPFFSWDTETSGLVPALGARVVGYAFAVLSSPGVVDGFYVPIRHIGPNNVGVDQLDPQLVADAVAKVFDTPGYAWSHHGKFDAKMVRADGTDVYVGQRVHCDTMIAATIDNENEPSFALKTLASIYCHPEAASEETRVAEWIRIDARKMKLPFRKDKKKSDGTIQRSYMNRFGYARTPVGLLGTYAIHDVFYTLFLGAYKYVDTAGDFPELWEREHRMSKLISGMEWRGLPVDGLEISKAYERTNEAVEYWLSEIRRIVDDKEFEPTDASLRKLFADYGMVTTKVTKSKLLSVDKEARKLLEHRYPEHKDLFKALNAYAIATKLHSTYALSYLRFYSSVTNSVHPSYNQIERREEGGVPVTGRLSSADPNAQNVAGQKVHLWNCGCAACVKDKDATPGPENTISVRRYFVVPKDHVRVYMDFSQIELRVLAWFCQDPIMLQAYRDGVDIHQVVADELHIARSIAKQVNFGNSYGMSEVGLAKRLPGYYSDPVKAQREAKQVLDAYFKRFKNILIFRDELAKLTVKRGGFLQNPFGRPRRIPDLMSKDDKLRERAERQMMSSIISGTAADLMKESSLRCDATLERANRCGAMVQTVHDELVFDIEKRPGWTKLVKQLSHDMTDWPMFSDPTDRVGVPIEVNIAISTTSWENKRGIRLSEDGISWA